MTKFNHDEPVEAGASSIAGILPTPDLPGSSRFFQLH